MFKFLIIILILFFGLIYLGNYLDLKHGRITQKQYNGKIRFFIVLLLIVLFLLFIKK